jgi:hypothetical protein
MIRKAAHPDRIDAFLQEAGFEKSQVDELFTELNLRRKDLLYRYKVHRNVRIVGWILVLISGAPGLIFLLAGGGPGTAVVSLGLLAYGIGVAVTGDLNVFSSEDNRKAIRI